MGEFILMRHEDDFDARFQQGTDNLPGNFGALPFVGRGEGLVEQQHRMGHQLVNDCAHPAQFLIELSAFHGSVFLTLVMREQAAANIGIERPGCHEHAGLHHQLS